MLECVAGGVFGNESWQTPVDKPTNKPAWNASRVKACALCALRRTRSKERAQRLHGGVPSSIVDDCWPMDFVPASADRQSAALSAPATANALIGPSFSVRMLDVPSRLQHSWQNNARQWQARAVCGAANCSAICNGAKHGLISCGVLSSLAPIALEVVSRILTGHRETTLLQQHSLAPSAINGFVAATSSRRMSGLMNARPTGMRHHIFPMKGGSFAADLLSVVRGRVGIARSAKDLARSD
jgi:hypothetical protein